MSQVISEIILFGSGSIDETETKEPLSEEPNGLSMQAAFALSGCQKTKQR